MAGLERSDEILELPDTHNVGQLTQTQWMHKGLDYYNSKQYRNALDAFEQAAQLDTNSIKPYYCMSLAQFMLGAFSEALAALEKAIQIQTDYVKAYIGKAIVLKKLQRYQEALAVCDYAIQLDPGNALVYTIKGKILYASDNHEEAVRAFEQALQLYLAHNSDFTATAVFLEDPTRTKRKKSKSVIIS